MEDKEILEMGIADTIIEKPIGFIVDEQHFYIYPVTLGKTYILARLLKSLETNEEGLVSNPYMEALRLCTGKKDVVCRILAYHTFNRKEELFDNVQIDDRVNLFVDKLDLEELVTLFTLVLSSDNTEEYIKYFGIDKERQDRTRIASVKKDNSSITFGGRSIYGTMIDFACQRYGWKMNHLLWEISYANLKMLMADAITTIYLSEEERKLLGKSVGEVINGDDPINRELVREMIRE